ncbi:MAG: PKD domain-containing protein [Deltaproteobacteria bacterium]|nr:PKD domain-containing protein [Deltaproteobacteria bacterium]
MHALRMKILLLSLTIVIFHTEYIHAWECEITINGPSTIKVGQTITLSASGAPEGGSYSWFNIPNLLPNDSSAELTGFVPSFSDYIQVGVTYTTPKGKRCIARKWIYVCICYVKISGPNEVKVGDTISLNAEGDPPDGTYAWSSLPGLVASGTSAQFTGQTPGHVTIEVTYTNPDEKTCSDTHEITVSRECSVSISGSSEVGIGDTISLAAPGSPGGGSYTWSPMPSLVANGSSAQFTGQVPGNVSIGVTYTTSDGGTCTDTHIVTAFGVGSITGPICVNSGSTLTKDHFTIMTDPIGFEPLITVIPLTFSILSQSEEAAVIASCGPGTADDATTTIMVVNSKIKNGKSISFEIPNFLNDVLKKIGLGDKTDLSVQESFKDFKECCEFGVFTSTDGTFSGNLSVDAGPFTIIGIPIPPKFKKWLAADLVNVTLSGGGSVAIDGSYKACEEDTDWSGGGDFTAGVELGGMVKAKVPEVIVLKGKIAGSTSINEKLSIDLAGLKLTPSWGGLTGVVSGEVKIPLINFKGSFEAKKIYFEQGDFLPTTIVLPSLEQ